MILAFVATLFFAHEILSQDGAQNSSGRRPPKKGPDVDMFINSWMDVEPRTVHGSLRVYDILTKCEDDPQDPKKKGAVLTDIERVSYAILKPGDRTEKKPLDGVQQVFYVSAGEGAIEGGEDTEDLMEGMGVLMPPELPFTIENTGDEDLAFYIIEEKPADDFLPIRTMLVRYEYDNPISTNVQRVNDPNLWLFNLTDGLANIVGVNTIMNEPKSFFPPHTHPEEMEEIWISLHGTVMIQIGLQRRKLPAGWAYKAPADGTTPHTNFNTTKTSQKLLWIMKIPVDPSARGREKGII